MTDTIRQAFEAWSTEWIEQDSPSMKADLLERNGDTYAHALQRVRWRVWKAAWDAALAAPQPQFVVCRYGDGGYACCEGRGCEADEHNDAIAKEQIEAQPVQEPFAHICILPTKDAGPTKFFTAPSDPRGFPVYRAAPVQPVQPAPLTDEELETLFCEITGLETGINPAAVDTSMPIIVIR